MYEISKGKYFSVIFGLIKEISIVHIYILNIFFSHEFQNHIASNFKKLFIFELTVVCYSDEIKQNKNEERKAKKEHDISKGVNVLGHIFDMNVEVNLKFINNFCLEKFIRKGENCYKKKFFSVFD